MGSQCVAPLASLVCPAGAHSDSDQTRRASGVAGLFMSHDLASKSGAKVAPPGSLNSFRVVREVQWSGVVNLLVSEATVFERTVDPRLFHFRSGAPMADRVSEKYARTAVGTGRRELRAAIRTFQTDPTVGQCVHPPSPSPTPPCRLWQCVHRTVGPLT